MHMVKVQTPVLYPVFAQGTHNAIERILPAHFFAHQVFFLFIFPMGI